MLTTAGFSRSATSANDATAGAGTAAAACGGQLARRGSGAEIAARRHHRPGDDQADQERDRRDQADGDHQEPPGHRPIIEALARWSQAVNRRGPARDPAEAPGTPPRRASARQASRAFSALLPGLVADDHRRRLLADRPGHLARRAVRAPRRLLARHRRQRPGDDVGPAGQRPEWPRRAPLRLGHLHPDAGARAAARPARRLRGSSSQLRTDAARTGPISGVSCSCSTVARARARPSTRTPAPAPARRARRRGGCRGRR